MVGTPRRFKVYVGNRILYIVERVPPDRWGHVKGLENPADAASRGLFPAELLRHELWWNGPTWLHCSPSEWPKQSISTQPESSGEESDVCLHVTVHCKSPIIPYDYFSSFSRLKRMTAWMFRFIQNCRKEKRRGPLSVGELASAETYWLSLAQRDNLASEIRSLESRGTVNSTSSLFSFHPVLNSENLLRVGGRQRNSRLSDRIHPIILSIH